MTMGSSSSPSGELLPFVLKAGDPIVRIHHVNNGALWFGPAPGKPPAYRFDAPSGEFRVLYGSQQIEGAYVETVLRKARRLIDRGFVEERQWSELTANRNLKLAKLFDEGLLWHGLTGDIGTGDDYRPSQAFSLSLYENHPDLDGIAYRARHNNGQICFALYDRVQSNISTSASHAFAKDIATAERLMRMHNASWDTSPPVPPL